MTAKTMAAQVNCEEYSKLSTTAQQINFGIHAKCDIYKFYITFNVSSTPSFQKLIDPNN